MTEASRLRAQACLLKKPRHAEIREMQLTAPTKGQALVRTLFTAISRGTESLVYEGRVPLSEHKRMRAPFQEGDFDGPVKYGYINVGVVEEGPAELEGKRVWTLFPHQTRFVVPVSALTVLPDALESGRAVLLAGMETALNAIWDGGPKVGDTISVVGGGVVGCLCAYLAARIPGTRVELVDTNADREGVAKALGVDFRSPAEAQAGSDLVFHLSASESGLATALALAGREASIVEVSWFGDRKVALALGEAFHSQRLRLISSQVGSLPAEQLARWDHQRRLQCAMALLQDPALDILISGESDFADLPTTLAELSKGPGALCHRIRYPDSSAEGANAGEQDGLTHGGE